MHALAFMHAPQRCRDSRYHDKVMTRFTIDGTVSVLQACQPTHVLHLAAQAGVRYAKKHPMSYITSNVHGTTVLFEVVAQQQPRPHVVYASSSSVYGGNAQSPFSESDRVDSPLSLYAATKRSCELLATVYSDIGDISMTGLRFFTVYGPWGRPDMAALVFAHAIAGERPVRIFRGHDNAELARDFTYIDDIVKVSQRWTVRVCEYRAFGGTIGASASSNSSAPQMLK
jgi:UDP-glucuronate 4-epimerase